jgi:hypothetical protein
MKNGNYLVVFTESYLKDNKKEGAHFYQFIIELNFNNNENIFKRD